jgi:hypothetical protein
VSQALAHSPLFIIGPPRCGSTLLYQVLAEAFDLAYFSNVHELFFGGPAAVERWLNPRRKRKPSDFSSRHGQVKHWAAPSECGSYWYRFFRSKPQYVPGGEEDPEKMQQLRRSMHAMTQAVDVPLLVKNMPCALRLVPLAEALPEALFIVMHRGWLDNAKSLLEVRRKIHGDMNVWWSMEPPGIENLVREPPHVQVVEQVRRIHALIDRDRARIGSARFMDIRYETFRQDVHATLDEVDVFARGRGVQLKRRAASIPETFEAPPSRPEDEGLHASLVDYLNEG